MQPSIEMWNKSLCKCVDGGDSFSALNVCKMKKNVIYVMSDSNLDDAFGRPDERCAPLLSWTIVAWFVDDYLLFILSAKWNWPLYSDPRAVTSRAGVKLWSKLEDRDVTRLKTRANTW